MRGEPHSATSWVRRFVPIAILASGLLASCKGKTSIGRSSQHFALTIALVKPLGTAGDPLPQDVKTLSSPVESNNCPGVLYIPDVTVIRLDSSDAKAIDLGLGRDQNAVQRALGQQMPAAKLRAARAHALDTSTVSPAMAEPGNPSAVTGNLRKVLGTGADRGVFAVGRMAGLPADASIVPGVRQVIERLGAAFCEKTARRQYPVAFLVVYSPGDPEEVAAEPAKTATEPATMTSIANPVVTPIGSADALFDQLSEEVNGAIAGRMTKRAVHAHLAKAQAEMSWDYRFTYERAKLAVYGIRDHHEAFHHLFRAAEIAISNGDAPAMSERLRGDSEENGPFHPLRHGHGEWKTLSRALETKDAAAVRR